MGNCEEITELLPMYINKNTTNRQNKEIAHHMSLCMSCRADYALWLSLERTVQKMDVSAAAIDYGALFAKLQDEESELCKILSTGSYSMAFDLIRYAFDTIKSTYRLVSLIG